MQALTVQPDPAAARPPGQEADRAKDVLQGRSPDLLGRIHDPAVELVVWERSLSFDLAAWLEAVPPRQLPDGRLLVTEPDLSAALAAMLDSCGTPDGPLRAAFLHDVVALAAGFLATMASDTVDLRLQAIRDDACWKFHRDCVAARLLTTYRGPGTQWVQPAHSAAALSRQKSYEGPIRQFPRHAVGLFKGSCTPPAKGIVHRSPAIAATGTTRLVLCLNLPSAASPALWNSR